MVKIRRLLFAVMLGVLALCASPVRAGMDEEAAKNLRAIIRELPTACQEELFESMTNGKGDNQPGLSNLCLHSFAQIMNARAAEQNVDSTDFLRNLAQRVQSAKDDKKAAQLPWAQRIGSSFPSLAIAGAAIGAVVFAIYRMSGGMTVPGKKSPKRSKKQR